MNNVDVYNLRHKDAQDIIVRSGNSFELTVQRGGSTWRPSVTPTGSVPSPSPYGSNLNTVTKTSLAHKQPESQHIGCGMFFLVCFVFSFDSFFLFQFGSHLK